MNIWEWNVSYLTAYIYLLSQGVGLERNLEERGGRFICFESGLDL
jgi:hypothetical protein